jgi:hypothetical protein
MLTKSILELAAKIDAQLKAGYEAYQEERESYWRRGLQPHHCEHGSNLWTDYDNICGPCEDGITMGDGAQRMRHALDRAKYIAESTHEALHAISTLRRLSVIGFGEDMELLIKRIQAWWEV